MTWEHEGTAALGTGLSLRPALLVKLFSFSLPLPGSTFRDGLNVGLKTYDSNLELGHLRV